MGKIIEFLKKNSFGAHKTGLYYKESNIFGSVLSVILSGLFLISLLIGIGFYSHEFFIQRKLYLTKQDIKNLS